MVVKREGGRSVRRGMRTSVWRLEDEKGKGMDISS